ncbi:AraC family transcriptional regulator [Stutzerimonas stutzeri]|uniref:AraC family transcriptional regulator n=1 Tax=Stutzerimonas stutzeri TaxID=316 RepID=UPI00244A9540|nr:AraC family transcriptional regulator [Stutzerimonas stutzeri]MDH0426629.1 AraC family transcriptional regulator [Stutzerimonas stutzeri]
MTTPSSPRTADYHLPARQLLHGPMRNGLTLAPLLEEAGIASDLLADSTSRVDTHQFIRLLRGVTQALGDEFFGLSERRAKEGTSAMLVDLMLGCSTLGAALEQASNFFRILTDDLLLDCTPSDDDIQLSLHLARPELDPEGFLLDYWLVYLHRFLSWSTGQLIPVKQVMSSTLGHDPGRLLSFVRQDWQAGMPVTSLVISRKYWTQPIVRTRSEWRDHRRRLVEEGILGWPEGDSQYSNQVKSLLLKALIQRQAMPRLQDIASTLCMSVQTLHRHLQHEGNGYQRILDDLRRDYAIELLAKQHVSIAAAAECLGFAEARSFSRAFKQWTGLPPSAVRCSGNR